MFVRSGPALGSSPRSGPDGSPSRSAFGSAQTGSRNLPGVRAPQIRSRQAPDGLTGIRPRQDSRQSAGGSSPPDPAKQAPAFGREFAGSRVFSGPSEDFAVFRAPCSSRISPDPKAVRRLPVFGAGQPRAVPPPCRSQRFADFSGPRSGPAPSGFRCRAAPDSPGQPRAVLPPAAGSYLAASGAAASLPAGIPASVLSDIAASSRGHAASAAARSASSARSASAKSSSTSE